MSNLHDPSLVADAIRCPQHNVAANMPLLFAALEKRGVYSELGAVGVLAILSLETSHQLKPTEELADEDYFKRYDKRPDIGNIHAGDGYRYHYRGYRPINGLTAYEYYGRQLGVNLLKQPELALDPVVAADILALYWFNNKITPACEAKDWLKVQKLFNRSTTGRRSYLSAIRNLLELL